MRPSVTRRASVKERKEVVVLTIDPLVSPAGVPGVTTDPGSMACSIISSRANFIAEGDRILKYILLC